MKYLNIVSFDVPYPPNYGGVIDVFYKIKYLKKHNVNVILHCFDYGRGKQNELLNLCYKVIYYKRTKNIKYIFSTIPSFVNTRNNIELLKNLLDNNYPILFEGLHSCFYLNHPELVNRNRVVRTHNIELEYYKKLAIYDRNIFNKIHYFFETLKLKNYEVNTLKHASAIAAISKNDFIYLKTFHNNVNHVSAFHPNDDVISKIGKGDFILYHGTLSIPENLNAAIWLVKNVFSKLNYKCIIIGNCKPKSLSNLIKRYKNIELISNIPTNEIHSYIQNAHINILPTFQNTGIKLKLLAAIFNGRFCIANSFMVENTGLDPLCIVKNSPTEMINSINEIMKTPFTEEIIEYRRNYLNENNFTNEKSITNLLKIIFPTL